MTALQHHSSGVEIQDLPCSIIKDKYMMKAQVHVSKSFAIYDIQALPRKKYYCQIYQVVKHMLRERLLASFQDLEHEGTPSSTTINQDVLSTSTSQTTPETTPPVIPLGVQEADHDIEVAHMDNNPNVDFQIPKSSSEESSTQVVILNNVHSINQPPEHINKWTKDHPIDNMIGDPSRPVSTRHQLQYEALLCYFDVFLSSVETKRAVTSPKSCYDYYLEVDIQGETGRNGWCIENKARLVARGYRQEEGIDFKESFTPFARLKAIRIFIAFDAHINMVLYQMDVKITFLNRILHEEDSYIALTAFTDADHAGFQDTKKCDCAITMADVNVNAPAGQAPTMVPPMRTDDQILPHIRWVPIGKSSCYLDVAFTTSSTIPSIYIQQFWDTVQYDKSVGCYMCQLDEQWFNLTKDTLRDALQITPVNDNQAFTSPPSSDALINFVNKLGYPKLVRNLSNVVPSTDRVKISSTNLRLETTVPQKEETFQVVIDAFTISADVLEIFMQKFRYTIKKSDSPKKSRGKGSQGKKTVDDSQETIDVSKDSEPEPVKRKTASRRVVKKTVTNSVADNIIHDLDVALELGESISLTKPEEEEATKQVHATHVTTSNPKLKGVQSLTPVEKEAADIMHALKECKKTRKRHLDEGTGTKPRVLDEEKDDKQGDADDEGDDHISDTQDADDKDVETESDEDEIYKYKIRVRKDEDEELTNAKVEESRNGDEEDIDVAKADVEKTEEAEDDSKKAKLPPTSSSLSISLAPVTTLPFPSVSTTPLVPQQTTTPIPTPPITTKTPTITTDVLESDDSRSLLSRLRPDIITKSLTPSLDGSRRRRFMPAMPSPRVKSASEIIKIKKEQVEKQKIPKYTIKSTNKEALKEYDQKSTLYQTMRKNKSFNRNPANHKLYHVLMEALIEYKNAIDKEGKKTKRRRTKESESLKKPSSAKETPKGKASSKGSKTGKSASAKEPAEEPIAEVVMDDAGKDVVHDDDQPQDTFEPKTTKSPNLECIKLEYDFQESFNALIDKLNWNNPEKDRYPFDMSKPLPLQSHPGHLTIAADYFFNIDLEYLKSDLERTYKTSIMKTKAGRYKIVQIKDMVPTLWSPTKVGRSCGERADRQLYTCKEGDFMDLHLNDIEDMLLLVVQHKLFYLNESDLVDFIVALRMFTRSLIIKCRVKHLQLGVESYQKKLNITPPQQIFPEIKFKELYTSSYKPLGVIYKDLAKYKRVIRANELYKFSYETLKKVQDELYHKVLDFRLGYNKEMSRRK
nr:hypothetical protein [Tanacetum cinerariifolium]